MNTPTVAATPTPAHPITPANLAAQLAQIADREEQRALLANTSICLSPTELDELSAYLKQHADRLLRIHIQESQQMGHLLQHLAHLTGNRAYEALGLRALGNTYAIGLGEFQAGLDCYDTAAAIYADLGDTLQQAQSRLGAIWALACLGRYTAALAVGEWAADILRLYEAWPSLATLLSNMAASIYGRLGRDAEALNLFNEAHTIYTSLGPAGQSGQLMVILNRAIVLRNLGRFRESIADLQTAWQGYRAIGEVESAARAQQNLALTYFILGRYNEALTLLDEARTTFLADNRLRHAMLVELFISNCLLQLRRFDDVLHKAQQIRTLFQELGASFEVGQAILNEATAYMGLEQFPAALTSLAEARQIFAAEGNAVAVADTDLQTAVIHLQQGQSAHSLTLAQSCAHIFQAHDLPIGQARAYLVAARSALACQSLDLAADLVAQAQQIGQQHQIPAIVQQTQTLTGLLAVQQGDLSAGLHAYEQAITTLEQLYGRLMIEFRADFLADKTRVYEDAVLLCLQLDQPEYALTLAERAKSRALQDLVALRLDLSIETRNPADQPLVDELHQLRTERDRLYRRWETDEENGQRGQLADIQAAKQRVEQRVLTLEKQITDLWHQLLIRNADYAHDAALWQVRTESAQPYLDQDTVLIEYFLARDHLVLFLVTAESVTARRLSVSPAQIGQGLQMLWLNLKAVPHSPANRLPALTQNAQGILRKLYDWLLRPLAADIAPYKQRIIVPHGHLHYLPFHALHDGTAYWVTQADISYLPGSSLLRYCHERRTTRHPTQNGLLAVGHSVNGRLPHAVHEARTIANLWADETRTSTLLVEAEATTTHLHAAAPHSQIIHLATHGEFRPDNPVFSGLSLADGWLTTLDIFNFHLNASLVTLSACQTGRSVIGGGDELLGLMRAFLAAGAASLVATFWTVADHSTAHLMRTFYTQLRQGHAKGSALRQAQINLLATPDTAHPYFWAPFFLVGDAGPLTP